MNDIMTTKVVSISPGAPLSEAAQMMNAWGFSGLPVVDENRRLEGLITQSDFLSSDKAIHIPTLQRILESMTVDRSGKRTVEGDVQPLKNLTVRDVMNSDPITLRDGALLPEVIDAFRRKRAGEEPIPVVDEQNVVVGVVGHRDIIKLFDYTTES